MDRSNALGPAVATGAARRALSGPRRRVDRLRSALKLLAHATKCAGCDSTNCVKMKKILMHALMCKTRPISGCMLCRQAYGVLQLHAVHCTAAPGACRVPKCQEFKQMLAAMPTAQSTKIASKFAL